MARSRASGWAAAAIALSAAAFAWQAAGAARAWSQTFDEGVHVAAGYSYLSTGAIRLNPEHPPLMKELAALPIWLRYGRTVAPVLDARDEWHAGRRFLYESPVPAETLLWLARLPSVALGSLQVVLVAVWAGRLWGRGAAVLAAALAALEPTPIAHAALATTDVGVSVCYVAACWASWEAVRQRSSGFAAAAAIAAGLATASKFSGGLIVVIAAAAAGWVGGRPFEAAGGWRWRPMAIAAAGSAALAAATLWATYGFGDLAALREGLAFQAAHQAAGHPAYFWGAHGAGGWPAYFPAALALKSTIGLLILTALSLVLWRRGRRFTAPEAALLVAPAAAFLGAAMASRLDIGVRSVLPLYPLACVIAARVATFRPRPAGLLAGAAVLGSVWAAAGVRPHYLSYFNALAGGVEGGSRYLSDSNVDWGQDLGALATYVRQRGNPIVYLAYFGTADPAYYGLRYQRLPTFNPAARPEDGERVPASGPQLVAISVTNLTGDYLRDPRSYRYFAAAAPVARVGGSILVYDVTDQPEAHRALAGIYRRVGDIALAALEDEKAVGR